MPRVLSSVLLFAAGLALCAQDPKGPKGPPEKKAEKKAEKVAVALNTGGHTAPVVSMVFTPDGKRLVTCEPTRVHVWSVPGGELERTWRLPSAVDRVAVSPDGGTVAAMGNVEENPVWLLDLKTGDSKTFDIQGVAGHYGIRSLTFSPDGKRLAWCTWYQAGVINIKLERVSHLIKRGGPANSVAFDQTGTKLLVNGGIEHNLNQFQVYEVKPGKDAANDKRLFELEESAASLGRVTWSTDNAYFAGWFHERGQRVFVWKADGKLHLPAAKKAGRAVPLPGDPYVHHLQFVGPEKLVAVGTHTGKAFTYLINAATHKIEKSAEFAWDNPQQIDLVVAVAPTGKYLAMTNSPGYGVQLMDLEAGTRLRDLGHSFPIPEDVAWSADGKSISWTLGTDRKGEPIPPGGLNLSTLTPLGEKDVAGFKRRTHAKGYKLEFDGDKRRLFVVHDKNKKRVETNFNSPVRQHTFYTDPAGKQRLLVLGSWGAARLSVIDPDTGATTDLDEYSGGHAMSVSPDGKYLLLARNHQALDIYKFDGWVRLLRVAVAGQDWVVWTNPGHYAATFNGERLVGFTSRTDDRTPLTFYPVERFRKQLYRPELIKRVLEEGSVAAAAKATKTPPVVVARVLPPHAKLELVSQTGDRVRVRATAATGNEKPIESLRLQVDGRSLPLDEKGNPQGYFEPKGGGKAEVTWDVTVPPGVHQLSVLVSGSDTSDRSNPVEVRVPMPESSKPTMYCLSVGIDYRWDPGLKDDPGWLSAAENDARTMLTALRANCAGPGVGYKFREVKAGEPLLGKEATRKAVLARLTDIREKGAKPGDLVVLFYAGHGVAQGREFYLLTADVNPKDIPASCLSGSELREALKAMPCQVLLIFDACNSGRALDRFAPATDELGRSLANDEAGVTVLAASMAHEYAGEKGGTGRLTAALRDALNLAPGTIYDPDDKIMTVRHLHTRAEDVVRRQSNGKQHPVLLAPWSTPPLVIRKVP